MCSCPYLLCMCPVAVRTSILRGTLSLPYSYAAYRHNQCLLYVHTITIVNILHTGTHILQRATASVITVVACSILSYRTTKHD